MNSINSKKKPEKFLKFLNEVWEWDSEKDEIIFFLQEYLWHLLIPDTTQELALIFKWTWCNGKWTLLETIEWILWQLNTSVVSMKEIQSEGKNWYAFMLKNSLLNVEYDMSEWVDIKSWLIKKIISWEPINAKQVFADPFPFRPYARFIIGTNYYPNIDRRNDGIVRRLALIKFPNSFLNKKDPKLKDKLMSERDEIFWRLIQWLQRYIQRGEFILPPSAKKNLSSWYQYNESIKRFIEARCDISNSESWIASSEIYEHYNAFCLHYSYQATPINIFQSSLENMWYLAYKKKDIRGRLGIIPQHLKQRNKFE